MAFGNGMTSLTLEDIRKEVDDVSIISHYLGIRRLPCLISSPLRQDRKPSFALYMRGNSVRFKDFATGEGGSIYTLFQLLWHKSFKEVLTKICKDLLKIKRGDKVEIHATQPGKITIHNQVALQCRIREWRQHDIEYWQSYGVPLEWLKYAEVYPISHKIVMKDDEVYTFGADKYAYAFVERKEGKVTLKIYQPYNKAGFKWSNKHDRSVISLWTKIPETGDKVVICSSLKDALCLWSNTGIPAIAVQGEGYSMSTTAINELKRRYNHIYILFDNDLVGLNDGIRLASETGFTNIVLPEFVGGKDISDLYKVKGKEEFLKIMNKLFNDDDFDDDLPF